MVPKNNYIAFIKVKYNTLVKSFTLLLFLILVILFILNNFKYNTSFKYGILIIVIVTMLYNIALCKNFKLFESRIEIIYFFLPFKKSTYKFDDLEKIVIHYKLKGRDVAFIKLYDKNYKHSTYHFININSSDILTFIKVLQNIGLKIEEV